MARRVSSPRLVGRTKELAQLDAALDRARAGTPAAVLVAGEAGVGKTLILLDFKPRAVQPGWVSWARLQPRCAAQKASTVCRLAVVVMPRSLRRPARA